ncbi:hypothetical protein PT974_02694 [Cladobotryum mycophilum]|uniref:Uncharacterized protein n=1 Tax=Cladobotryum mycophilum TaxID=491253 RepID=A0ABR0SZC5_9HYPO
MSKIDRGRYARAITPLLEAAKKTRRNFFTISSASDRAIVAAKETKRIYDDPAAAERALVPKIEQKIEAKIVAYEKYLAYMQEHVKILKSELGKGDILLAEYQADLDRFEESVVEIFTSLAILRFRKRRIVWEYYYMIKPSRQDIVDSWTYLDSVVSQQKSDVVTNAILCQFRWPRERAVPGPGSRGLLCGE